jgi:alanyl-tRNA synthetase
VITHACPPEDAASFPLRKEPTVEAGVLRVVEIDGIEFSACCGTHVRSTAALGAFRIIKVEKYKAGCRAHFVAGGRAFADYRRLAGLVRDSSAIAGIPEDELAGAVSACRERVKSLERSLEDARSGTAAAEASALDGSAPAGAVIFAEASTFDSGSRLARALAARGRVSVIRCVAETKAVACSPAPEQPGYRPVDAAFGQIARELGGKGGGGKTFFQAAFSDAASLDGFMDAARLA